MSKGELRVNCPTCGKEVARLPCRKPPFFPFCCERCKLLDLGKWFDGEHRIEGLSESDREGVPGGDKQD
ncbi:MAG: DNA gyrase inhibitor YacG [Candidatus Brocadiae bacterium]|nr:DNA gyrase inhibitor YacG [Candidatus Brocadiia bacterium]